MALHDLPLRVVLHDGDGTEPLNSDDRYSAVRALLERGFPVTRNGPARAVAPADGSPLLVLGR